MGRFTPKWPKEVRTSIADAVSRGTATGEMYRQICAGTLPGLSRAYEIPRRTFFQYLSDARREHRAANGQVRRTEPLMPKLVAAEERDRERG